MVSGIIKLFAALLTTAKDDSAIVSLPNLLPELNEALEPLLPKSWQSNPVSIHAYGKGIECVFHLRKPGMGLDCIEFSLRFNRVVHSVDGTMIYKAGKAGRRKSSIVIKRLKMPDVISSDELGSWIWETCSTVKTKTAPKKFEVTFGMLVHYTVPVLARDREEAIATAREIDLTDAKPCCGMEELSADAAELDQ